MTSTKPHIRAKGPLDHLRSDAPVKVAPLVGCFIFNGAVPDGLRVDLVITEDAVNSVLEDRSSTRMEPAAKPIGY